MKREFIDRNSLFIPSDENEYDELVQFADDVMNAEVITEQEIVKPYLEKLKKQIEELKNAPPCFDDMFEYKYAVDEVLAILDRYKYKAESEPQESEE